MSETTEGLLEREKEEGIDKLRFAAYCVPLTDYHTTVLSFPGTNCMPPYGLKGDFFLEVSFYSNSRLVGTLSSTQCNEKGQLELDFDSIADILDVSENPIICANYYHTDTVPVELYFSSVHRKSKNYHAYPALPFMGDVLYADFHDNQLENTLFWPGVAENSHTETCLVVVNPYQVSFSFQVSVFLDDVLLEQTGVLRAKRYSGGVFSMEELFPDSYAKIRDSQGRCSICISAQYKVVAYVMFRLRKEKLVTTIDHMHAYQLV